MGSLFNVNIANGIISINNQYKLQLQQLIDHIKQLLLPNTSEKTLYLNHWSYRPNSNIIAHSLEFSGNENQSETYTLTLIENGFIEFTDFSFTSNEGEVYVYDSVDVNGFLHYLHQYLKHEQIRLIFSFLNNCS
ncbi:hypothetical protein A6046_00935 [[Haemophilus] ducreyi]|uniref:Uncharacterized protein n=2 Tax=Haemophilus ducreyi TaxID=730 RepID=Q7VML8_HAEDU|nr:hypothetical protein [[Haemophilus] ducreyi]AAP95838.1 hypothetical protein HD_0957 [[Haemophilus] ducreyi 35000HP]AKO30866.1 hypothetical protein RY60_03775 [[Haemophilus] ducreyi]AKO32304.1 hypothetical protein RZ57_03780 [[Haemophilus] ducreyi]AKO33758.1 hypothetical protein RZ58_03795 [[Haemophilus] ducreyi]AKO35206.1 hypothetical protein RZ59_03760 [[Haemophilus] ducreyi]